MKNRLSSLLKTISGGDACTICAGLVAIIAVLVVYKVMMLMHQYLIDYVALHDIASWRP